MCEATTARPPLVRPTFSTATPTSRSRASRSASISAVPSPTPSRKRPIARVSPSAARWRTTSGTPTSGALPVQTAAPTPMPRSKARSQRIPATAPDPSTNATGPSIISSRVAKALAEQAVRARTLTKPGQFGPSSRTPASRQARASSRSSAAPSGPVSRKPPEKTASAPAPRSMQARAASSTPSAGSRITARSMPSGRSAGEGRQGTPWISSRPGLTASRSPS